MVERYRNTMKHLWKRVRRLVHRSPRLYSCGSAERVGIVYTAPSDMKIEERLFLFALIRALKPKRALEIGVQWGGSACIIASAMQDNGFGKVAGIDPQPQQFRARPSWLHGRYTLLAGSSPEKIPEAVDLLDGKIDLVLIDAWHTYSACLRDLRGVLPFVKDGGYIILHDAYHHGINAAIDKVLCENTHLRDCGHVCRSPTINSDPWVAYHGFRLLFVCSSNWGSLRQIAEGYEDQGRQAAPFAWDIVNHGPWTCKNVEPCDRCKRLSGLIHGASQ